jgi:anti-sigma B factor antagonist
MAEYHRLKLDETGDITIVRFCQRRYIDSAEIEELGLELYRVVEDGQCKKLVLDFSSVEMFSSAAFGKLISLNGKVRAHNGALRLCNIPKQLFDVFRICKLDRIFDVRQDESDALMAFSS